jgi:hypothetical protein
MTSISIPRIAALSTVCGALLVSPAQVTRPAAAPNGSAPAFLISFPAQRSATPLDGRLLLLVSNNPGDEPRFQLSDDLKTQMVFGLDVQNWRPATPVRIDDSAFGYPVRRIADIPPGDYIVQAVLDRYETYRRADGRVLKLPADRGEGRQWNRAPGNLYSKPVKLAWAPGKTAPPALLLDQEIAAVAEPKDTKYIRHAKMLSPSLTKFWGRPVYLGASILVPEGFDEHPEARYPLIVNHGHFSPDFDGFRTEPPDPDLKPDFSDRFQVSGYNRIVQQEAYDFFRKWSSPAFPRFLIIDIQHANPFFDDSYAVNSANIGPYGDAIMNELVPYIEHHFRGIGEGWARFAYGGSTGGWEALAALVFYPDQFNGVFASCPDPIDFRAYTSVNVYQDRNAYYAEGPHMHVPRPGKRDNLGHISVTLQDMNYYELALGSHGRSGQQWDAWEAVFSPVGPDGYPRRIWDRLTGVIDKETAAYWREHYDLRHILRRDWAKLGPRVRGKIHIYCGDMDNYYLNNAVYLMEDWLTRAANPPAEAEVAYGDRAEHCWNGDPDQPNYISRLRYHTMYVGKIVKRMEATAPPGADLKSWRY